MALSIAALKLLKSDTVFLDLCSNSAYMGTDRNGLPAATEKTLDGKYHLQGDLQTAPWQVFCRILRDCLPVLKAAAAATVTLLAPTPRYVMAGCCNNPDHVTNIDKDFYEEELHLAVTHFRSAAASLPNGLGTRITDVYQLFGQDEYAAKDLCTEDDLSIWLGWDPVHLTDAAYMRIGLSMVQGEEDDEVFQPPRKRQRLESVVPVIPPTPAAAAKAPPATPGWLTGRLEEPKRGGKRGGWPRGSGRGSGGRWSRPGFQRGGSRGGGRGRLY